MAKERRAVSKAAASCREILIKNLQKTSAQPNHQAKTLCPVATPGCACLPPAGAFTISICWFLWLLLKFCSDFTTAHMHPPRPFVVKWRYAEVFLKLDP